MENKIREKRQTYMVEGRFALDQARDFLHANADEWSEAHEEAYRQMIGRAASCCAKMLAMDELLAGK